MLDVFITLLSASFLLIPYSIVFDFYENENFWGILDDFKDLLLTIYSIVILLAPVFFWTAEYLFKHNYYFNFSDLSIQILLYFIGSIFVTGFVYTLYDMFLKYPTRFMRSLLYKFCCLIINSIFYKNKKVNVSK